MWRAGNIQRKQGAKVTHVASNPPSIPARRGGKSPGERNAAIKPTNWRTMTRGPASFPPCRAH